MQLAATGRPLARLTRAAAMGELLTPLGPGPLHLWDEQAIEIELYGGHLASVDEAAALAGANRIAVETDAGEWEAVGFAGAELIGPGAYRLTRLLRGQGMTDPAIGPTSAGNRIVVLDAAVSVLPVEPGWVGGTLALRAFAGRHDATGTGFEAAIGLGPLLPLPPAHLVATRGPGGDIALDWTRRSRADAGSWAVIEVPHDNLPEAYRVTITDGGSVVRSFDVTAPSASYPAAVQVADFGSLPAGFDFTVAQLSPLYGPGHAATGAFHA